MSVRGAKADLRTPGEWAQELGVSVQTARKWLNEIPDDAPPLELERMLQDRKAGMWRRGGADGGLPAA